MKVDVSRICTALVKWLRELREKPGHTLAINGIAKPDTASSISLRVFKETGNEKAFDSADCGGPFGCRFGSGR
jgi:hypothetical protein